RAQEAANKARAHLMEGIGRFDNASAAKLKDTATRISDNLDRLARFVAQRQALASEHAALVARLRQAHEKLSEKLAPMADDVAFTLTLGIQSAADKGELDEVKKTLGELADKDLASLQAVLTMRAEANLVLGILIEAADLPSKDLMPPVKDRFVAAAGHLVKAAAELKDSAIAKPVTDLVGFGNGKDNVFDLKEKEFAAVVAESRTLADELQNAVAALRVSSEAAANEAARASNDEIGRGRIILIGLALTSLAAAFGLGWFYIGGSVVRRISRLQSSMTR